MAENDHRKPIFVTGADGMLGHYFRGQRFFSTRKTSLDVRNLSQIHNIFCQKSFSLVVHLAALTNVDLCEEEPELAWETNATGTKNIAEACKRFDIPMIYISTAAIFSGNQKGVYAENDLPAPTSVYAKSKLAGEELVRKHLKHHWIIRIGWLMGGLQQDHKFVGTLLRKIGRRGLSPNGQMQGRLGKGASEVTFNGSLSERTASQRRRWPFGDNPTEIPVVTDTVGSLLYGFDLGDILWSLVRKRAFGTFHVRNQGICSRWDIALQLCKEFPNNPPVKLIPISSDRLSLRVPRPTSEVLLDTKTVNLGLTPLRSWKKALADYLQEWGQEL